MINLNSPTFILDGVERHRGFNSFQFETPYQYAFERMYYLLINILFVYG